MTHTKFLIRLSIFFGETCCCCSWQPCLGPCFTLNFWGNFTISFCFGEHQLSGGNLTLYIAEDFFCRTLSFWGSFIFNFADDSFLENSNIMKNFTFSLAVDFFYVSSSPIFFSLTPLIEPYRRRKGEVSTPSSSNNVTEQTSTVTKFYDL